VTGAAGGERPHRRLSLPSIAGTLPLTTTYHADMLWSMFLNGGT
jgi:hypothetical protein